ncbi:MAG TPA: efflux RND transporter permease subunit [Candidatus Thiothrix moscowensis]|uniref:efflux RND transporter permease subunit n=1 Tax=unclassified Thiothrix TaxID=2636184 RepID=UPI0025D07030|nr:MULTISPECIES: efflux RND transporter permease subunit [unclassified Thiothrix]HRJ52852.1 efflux RND transporter permease subunit [Candidatus Thiothrix moscowensis]HRJ93402.1 efflux RND transporter permease subunit [Candidatus Thiothrix moscowensis]
MNGFNLSEWALRHRNFVLYLMVLTLGLGIFGYNKLGQSEDPPFTFKVMLVQAYWPGATAQEIESQVTDRIEKVMLETQYVDVVRSFSRPGETNIFVIAKDNAPSSAMEGMFYDLRKRVGDMRHTLPQGVIGPLFNDEFGETYGNIFALTGDGFNYAQLRDAADNIRKELLLVKDVAKILSIGEQEERVTIELSNSKLANLGFSVQQLVDVLQAQNAVAAVGAYNTSADRIYVRPQGAFTNLEDIRNLPIVIGNRTLRLREVAEVKRGYADPPHSTFRYQGQEALGIGISMRKGGDIIALGKSLDEALVRIGNQLPVGMELHRVNDQPAAVKRSVGEFLQVVFEAVVIVLAVSFISLGLRAGTVVALSIPLVLAATFFTMHLFGIGLHKISLGSLVLALGLLVDDAIIAIEMMVVKMEEGWDRVKAASFAYSTTAFPMLTGTLVTAAGFLPIATAQSSVGEYTRSIFEVVTIALVISWFAAVIVIPYLGYKLLKEPLTPHPPLPQGARGGKNDDLLAPLPLRDDPSGGWVRGWGEGLSSAFYRWFRHLIQQCVAYPVTVILLTIATFAGSLFLFQFVQQQFFPDSTRMELVVDLKLPEGSSLQATQTEVDKLEQYLNTQQEHIDNFVAYVGNGSPRFYLPLDQQLPAASFAQFVITTNSIADREALRSKLIERLDNNPDFSLARGRVIRLENGPPVGYPVQFRVSGDDLWKLRELGEQVASVMRANPNLVNVHLDWNERSKAISLKLDTAKAISLGVTQSALSQLLQSTLSGTTIGEFREQDQTIPILLRGTATDRDMVSRLAGLNVPTTTGKTVPLSQLAKIDYVQEEGILWHRNRTRTITVRGDIYTKIQAPTVTTQVEAQLGDIRATLPLGYKLETGGAVEESAKGNESIGAGFPLFIVVVLTLLMIQLQSFQRVIMVVLTAPFGMIGVAVFLLLFDKPFGFVAMLGTIALSGMIMRNSVILVDQIERNIDDGEVPRDAVIEAAVRRFRPIMLTALAAILAMIPLSESVFFGPMAIAIMGGLLVATLLTLLFLPAVYTVWFKLAKGKQAFLGEAQLSG